MRNGSFAHLNVFCVVASIQLYVHLLITSVLSEAVEMETVDVRPTQVH